MSERPGFYGVMVTAKPHSLFYGAFTHALLSDNGFTLNLLVIVVKL